MVDRDRLLSEHLRYRAVLAILADPQSWGGNPEQQGATLFGHFTPYELARAALERVEAGDG